MGSILFRKLYRTMNKYRAQFVSMIIMIALGVAVFVGMNIEWYSIERNMTYFFETYGCQMMRRSKCVRRLPRQRPKAR